MTCVDPTKPPILCCLLPGDYYSYSNYDGSVEDVSMLNVDNQFNLIYKDFTTGRLMLSCVCCSLTATSVF